MVIEMLSLIEDNLYLDVLSARATDDILVLPV